MSDKNVAIETFDDRFDHPEKRLHYTTQFRVTNIT